MYSYITDELPKALFGAFEQLDANRVSITGHSMGGHGALTLVSALIGSKGTKHLLTVILVHSS